MDFELALNSFSNYIKDFDMKNTNVKIKYYHTLNVVNLIEKLAFKLGCSLEEIELAKLIGLLHDIGRFKQIEIAKEINDFKTKLDHAKLGVEYLFKENHIRDFINSTKYDEIIRNAILFHNKLEIPSDLDNKSLMYSKMIRDVDKIDIFRVEAIYFNQEIKDDDITPNVLANFQNHRLVDNKNIKTNSDETLSYFAYLYDFNFLESFEILNDTDNLELFIGTLKIKKTSEDFANNIFKEIRNYIKERLEKNDK